MAASDPVAAAHFEAKPVTVAVLPEDWLEWIWRAWWRLHADRPVVAGGMGPPIPGRIPWRDVILWADRHGYSDDQADFMQGCFSSMDTVYLEHWRDEAKASADRQAAAAKVRR